MINLLKLKEVIGGNGLGGILVTLEDGRCACVVVSNKLIIIEVLLDSFLKWTSFDEEASEQDIRDLEEALKNPEIVRYGPCAKDYLIDKKMKERFDKIKREADYNY